MEGLLVICSASNQVPMATQARMGCQLTRCRRHVRNKQASQEWTSHQARCRWGKKETASQICCCLGRQKLGVPQALSALWEEESRVPGPHLTLPYWCQVGGGSIPHWVAPRSLVRETWISYVHDYIYSQPGKSQTKTESPYSTSKLIEIWKAGHVRWKQEPTWISSKWTKSNSCTNRKDDELVLGRNPSVSQSIVIHISEWEGETKVL